MTRGPVDLGPGVQDQPLAHEIRRIVLANLARGGVSRAFHQMWGTVVLVVAPNPGRVGRAGSSASEPSGSSSVRSFSSTAHVTLTLRFDFGRLTIHEGRVGRPHLTLWGSADAILGLGRIAASWRKKLGVLGQSRRLASVWALGALRGRPGLKVYGAATHARFFLRLVRLLDAAGEIVTSPEETN